MKNHIYQLPPRIIFWGGTGQAKVNRPIVEYYGSKVIAVFDDTPNLKSPFTDIKVYHGWNGFLCWLNKQDKICEIGFCVSIGNPHGRIRLKLHEKLVNQGLIPVSLVHPSAFIDESVSLGEGVQIMAGVIIQPEVKIGKQCIINTKVSIDHECILEDGVEISPGATLCGNVYAELNSWICTGSTILPRKRIGHDAIVGAGSLVTNNISCNTIVYGVPAKIIRKINE